MEPRDLPRTADSLYAFHSGAPSPEEYERAISELVGKLERRSVSLGLEPPALQRHPLGTRPPAPAQPQRLVSAYAQALADSADAHPDLVALDGDLSLDTGMAIFRARHPNRFYECGIAEQDMVSQAGAMALAGLLPVVHSFACFLTARANEQIFNNATEGTRIIYVGSLAGIVPGGPGHSHQMVRDVALMGSIPGMTCAEPFCEAEARALTDWAVNEAAGPVYLRLVSVPWDLMFEPPEVSAELGRGTVLCDGGDMTIVCAGPVLVASAWGAARLLERDRVDATIIALPWLNQIDGGWLAERANGPILVLDNHVRVGGQGAGVAEALRERDVAVFQHSVDEVPVCGSNDEVLRHHALDADGVAGRCRQLLRTAVL
jgi:transketolase